MDRSKILVTLTLTFAFLGVTAHAPADTYPPFGPWRYYAPYYFAPSHSCLGLSLTPKDFQPRYESPNPLVPGPPRPCAQPPKKRVRKCAPAPGPHPQMGFRPQPGPVPGGRYGLRPPYPMRPGGFRPAPYRMAAPGMRPMGAPMRTPGFY
jgi:hypothetical protein